MSTPLAPPITISLTPGPLTANAPNAPLVAELPAGAVLTFEGIVRPLEDGRALAALTYQAYEPMATTTLTALAHDLAARHALLAVHCWHSTGAVPVGACSLRIIIASRHRKEGLAALDEFLDRLKRDVPIWKRPGWA